MAGGSPEEILTERLRFQALACERVGSPLYAILLARAAEDLEAHGPTWEVLRGHEGDPGPSALALRLMGAVNRLVLKGEEAELAAVYRQAAASRAGAPASQAGSDSQAVPREAEAWAAFRDVLERRKEDLRSLVELPVQTNEVGRSAALLPGFLAFAAETGLPLRLLEVGASAGLNLLWDSYRYRADGFAWGPADSPVKLDFELRGEIDLPIPATIEIAEREGCDASPIDPSSAEGRLSLLAYVWPDQPARVERLQAALGLAAELPASIERAAGAPWLRDKLAEPRPGRATLVYHSIVMQYMSDDERAEFKGHLKAAGEKATASAPLGWLRLEPAGELAEVRLSTWPGGEDRHLALAGYHGTPVDLSADPDQNRDVFPDFPRC
jgi:hypothetical protein